MKIQVIEADITAALAAPPEKDMVECCPIAQALMRIFPHQNVFVTSRGLKVGGAWFALFFNDPAIEVIGLCRHEWDKVRPFSFEVTQVVP